MVHFCDLVRAIGIYTGLPDSEIKLEVEKLQCKLGNGFTPEYAAVKFGERKNVPIEYSGAICEKGEKLTEEEISLLEMPARYQ